MDFLGLDFDVDDGVEQEGDLERERVLLLRVFAILIGYFFDLDFDNTFPLSRIVYFAFKSLQILTAP